MRQATCSIWVVVLALVMLSPSSVAAACIDGDGDGYGRFGNGSCPQGTTVDCDDTTAQCTTSCSDVDGDGLPDCNDLCPSVPFTTGTTRLNPHLVLGGDVDGFQFSPDDNWLVYSADQDTNGLREIYSVPARGGAPIKLSANGASSGFEVSPNSDYVTYRTYDDGVNTRYIVPIGGGPVTLVSVSASSSYEFSPDGNWIVFGSGISLFSMPVTGGNANQVTDPSETVSQGWQISPDSTRVVYHGSAGLSSATIDGSSQVVLAPTATGRFLVTSDGSRAVWTHYQATNEYNIESSNLDGSSFVVVGQTMQFLTDAELTPVPVDGDYRLVYLSGEDLFSAPISGGPAAFLDSFPSTNPAQVLDYLEFTPDGQIAVYYPHQSWRLSSVPVLGTAPPTALNSQILRTLDYHRLVSCA